MNRRGDGGSGGRLGLAGVGLLLLSACSTPQTDSSPTESPGARATSLPQPLPGSAIAAPSGPGRNFASAIQFAGVSNPLAYGQRQQQWLREHYRDWLKQGQALREHAGRRYDEVTLVNRRGETRVLYFLLPEN